MFTTRQEFIVTLKDHSLLESFYQDMENEGTNKSFIPSRSIECIDRRPISRNTHYLLTREEAKALANDERVENVELRIKNVSVKSQLHAAQTGTWSRGSTIATGQRNWGLYRCLNGINDSQWGSESANSEVTGTINLDLTGKNVDIVIVDEIVYPNHPEFGDRVIQYDWFGEHDLTIRGTGCEISKVARTTNSATITTTTAHNLNVGAVVNVVCTSDNSFNAASVTVTNISVTQIGDGGDGITVNRFTYANTGSNVSITNGTGYWTGVYQYDSYDYDNNHATHVAAIAAGDTQGWAREANIYNLRHDAFGASAGEYTPANLLVNYIKAFHDSKSINPQTGRKNPTIVNNSWGFGYELYTVRNPFTQTFSYDFTKLNYRSSDIRPSGTALDTGISGIYTANSKVSDLNSAVPGTANLIQTTGTSAGTVVSTTYAPNGRTGLTQQSITGFDPQQYSDNDEAYWTITLPFNIQYLTQSYSSIHVNSNSYVTFGGPSLAYILDATSPNIRKIFVSAGDRSCEGVWSGTFGTSGSRTFIVRWEGYEGAYSTTYESTPSTIWEMKFFEASPNTIQIHVVSNANYRGEFTDLELINNGLKVTPTLNPLRNSDVDADIADAIDDGIIFVGSSGNNGLKVDTSTGADYPNYVVVNGLPVYYNRGSSPSTSHPDVICVGSVDSASTETKAVDSNTGPRVDIYAPGRNVISGVFDGTGSINDTVTEGGGVYQKRSGTSMACAQVTGMLALALEAYPKMTPGEAKNFVTKFARATITDTEGGYDDNTSLQNGNNRFAYYRKERQDSGMLIPKTVLYVRPDSGAVFPRPQIRRT
jgi:hypothetical protein